MKFSPSILTLSFLAITSVAVNLRRIDKPDPNHNQLYAPFYHLIEDIVEIDLGKRAGPSAGSDKPGNQAPGEDMDEHATNLLGGVV